MHKPIAELIVAAMELRAKFKTIVFEPGKALAALALALMILSSAFFVNFSVLNDTTGYYSTVSASSDVEIETGFSSRFFTKVSAANTIPELPKTNSQGFRLQIPSINLNKEVVENVDPGDESVYGPVIAKSVAHGRYTKLPDEAQENGNVYLFAHRDGYIDGKYVGFFKRLGELRDGDVAYIHYAGKKYVYKFLRSFVITPQDTWVYTPESDMPILTLQTCENGESMRLMVQWQLTEVVV